MSLTDRHHDHRIGIVQEVLRSPGEPLGPAVRALMEGRFGRDLGRVRLHADAGAAASARALGARAYAAGPHVVFAEGAYDRGTREGLWLLAHELAHVIQQAGEPSAVPLAVADADDALERAADRAADLVAAGLPLPPGFAFGAAPAGVIQRNSAHPMCRRRPAAPSATLAVQTLERRFSFYAALQLQRASFLGSNWDLPTPEPPVPPRAPNQNFARLVLSEFQDKRPEFRPAILDFQNRHAWWFVDEGESATRRPTIESMFQFLNVWALQMGERQWAPAQPYWVRPVLPGGENLLPIPDDPQRRCVCTECNVPGNQDIVILYSLRQLDEEEGDKKKNRRAATSYQFSSTDQTVAPVIPLIMPELRRQFPWYDPANPEFVVIVSKELWVEWHNQAVIKAVFPPPSTGETIFAFVGGAMVVIPAAAAFAVIGAGAGAAGAGAAGAGAAGAGAAEVGAAEVASLAARRAAIEAAKQLASSSAAKEAAKAAGVLLVAGTVSNADAAVAGAEPLVKGIEGVRAVPVADFVPIGGQQAAWSSGRPMTFPKTAGSAQGKFDVGSGVLFDGKWHYIIAKFVAR
jgi:hypothetical protein